MIRRLKRKKVTAVPQLLEVALGLVAHHLAEVVCYVSNAHRAFGLVAQLVRASCL